MSGRGMSTAADLTSLEFDESFDAFDSLDSDFDLAWSPQNSDLPALGASGAHPLSTRVRFTALAELHSKSLGLEGRALVTNLSPRGLSLSSSLDLDPGTRVELTIALGFAAEEVTVEAEVLYVDTAMKRVPSTAWPSASQALRFTKKLTKPFKSAAKVGLSNGICLGLPRGIEG